MQYSISILCAKGLQVFPQLYSFFFDLVVLFLQVVESLNGPLAVLRDNLNDSHHFFRL